MPGLVRLASRSPVAEDLEEALHIRHELVALSEGTASHHEHVLKLSHSLHSQYRRDPGQLSVFDEGIKQVRDVLRVQNGTKRADVLVFRYNRQRRLDDLQRAQAYRATGYDEPVTSW
ncbi:hypothetical protein PHLCEN_2v11844 [Hermanssonia centrifuga]|uniref:Uncharacterized protein n=1 Tax=Hermanssonia centrifuga TaxID=98765 RepID=A0A2R6NJS4_9APHY|nr:hypothetical protein PHLCEN_2v11844 [Hermanssonia centrifuga]